MSWNHKWACASFCKKEGYCTISWFIFLFCLSFPSNSRSVIVQTQILQWTTHSSSDATNTEKHVAASSFSKDLWLRLSGCKDGKLSFWKFRNLFFNFQKKKKEKKAQFLDLLCPLSSLQHCCDQCLPDAGKTLVGVLKTQFQVSS